ncbi:MAG: hypothetical protein OXS28_05020, partial [Gammaproteobacteria bacterium]|nr:hypothetical protein [Gammaproteobacteria bacterium]
LSGKGIRVSGQSTLGIFATDVNNKESAVQIAPGLAYRRFAQEAMAAAGFKNPVEEIDNLYEKHLPSNEAYQGEADKFQDHYHVGMRVAKYLEIIERKAKTPDEYQKLYEAGRTEEGRKLHGGEEYMEILKKIPAYSPSSK